MLSTALKSLCLAAPFLLFGCKLKSGSEVKEETSSAIEGSEGIINSIARCGNASIYAKFADGSGEGYLENNSKVLTLTFDWIDKNSTPMPAFVVANPPNNLKSYFSDSPTLLQDSFVQGGLRQQSIDPANVLGLKVSKVKVPFGAKIYEDCNMATVKGIVGTASVAAPGSKKKNSGFVTPPDSLWAAVSPEDKKTYLTREWRTNSLNKLKLSMQGAPYSVSFTIGMQPTAFDPNGAITARVSYVQDKRGRSFDPAKLLVGLEKYASNVVMKNTGQKAFLSDCCREGEICGEFSNTGSSLTTGPEKYDLLFQVSMKIISGYRASAKVCVSRFDTEDQVYIRLEDSYFSVDG